MTPHVADYLSELVRVHQRGDAIEHTYRPALKTLIEAFDPTIIATNEPARQRCGAPDYVLQKNESVYSNIHLILRCSV